MKESESFKHWKKEKKFVFKYNVELNMEIVCNWIKFKEENYSHV